MDHAGPDPLYWSADREVERVGFMERVVERFRGYEWLGSSGDQQERDLAVVELLVLATHADREESPAERRLVRDYCFSCGWAAPMDPETAFEQAVATVAEATARPGGVEELFESICVRLGDAGAQQYALTEVAEAMLADGRIAAGEMAFVDRLRDRFGIA